MEGKHQVSCHISVSKPRHSLWCGDYNLQYLPNCIGFRYNWMTPLEAFIYNKLQIVPTILVCVNIETPIYFIINSYVALFSLNP